MGFTSEASNPNGAEMRGLAQMLQALGSAPDVDDLVAATLRAATGTVGPDRAAVRLLFPDSAGRLVVAGTEGRWPPTGRIYTSRRRAAFRTGTAMSVPLDDPTGWVLALYPLASREEALGVLEIAGPATLLAGAADVLNVVTSQVAIALGNLRQQARLQDRVRALATTVTLGVELMRARSEEEALQAAVRFQAEFHGGPVAAWLPKGDPPMFHLVAAGGMGTRKRRELRVALGAMAARRSLSELEHRHLVARFKDLLSLQDAVVLIPGDMLLLAGRRGSSAPVSLDLVGSLLSEVLRNLSAVAEAERRSQELDMGLAWTAHELRGPLVGVKAVLEFLQHEEEGSSASRAMLQRSQRELEQLAALTDGLLRWAVGAEPLRRRWTDVVGMVAEAVDSCRLEVGQDRFAVDAPSRMMARVDATHLRVAVANILRNALAYSPRDSRVRVRLAPRDGLVTVRVEDDGPGVAPEEQERIFDPFVRGEAGRRSMREGSGLGLFIARRIVEAHGGTVTIGSAGCGAVFTIELPKGRGRPAGADGRRRA